MGIPDKVIEEIERLEPLPATIQKLLLTLQDEEVDLGEIAEIIEYDGAITSNILRLANSAAFAGRSSTDGVRDAVVRMGTITLLDIMLIGHLRSMRAAAPIHDLSEDDLWLHGATASLAVKAIIKETHNREIPEASAIAALVHDIGKLIMVRYLKADLATILATCQENNLTFVEAERELFGCDHAEVGGAMAQKWSFPPQIADAIARHHQIPPVKPGMMLDAVMLADLAAKTLGIGNGAAGMNFHVDLTGSNTRIGLTPEGFERVCAQTDVWIEDLRRSFA